jgi:hypothetical protein
LLLPVQVDVVDASARLRDGLAVRACGVGDLGEGFPDALQSVQAVLGVGEFFSPGLQHQPCRGRVEPGLAGGLVFGGDRVLQIRDVLRGVAGSRRGTLLELDYG